MALRTGVNLGASHCGGKGSNETARDIPGNSGGGLLAPPIRRSPGKISASP